MRESYDLLTAQLACLEKLDTLSGPQGGRIAEGIASTMRRVLGLISKTHAKIYLDPTLSKLDFLLDLWALFSDLESQLAAVHTLSRLRGDCEEQAAA